MNWEIVVLVFVGVIIKGTDGQNEGQLDSVCSNDSQCKVKDSICGAFSQVCDWNQHKYCKCREGFKTVGGQCSKSMFSFHFIIFIFFVLLKNGANSR